ncbi:lipid A deacylase LpxR family protein [uncultured Aquimarina sp.]|uniref:lipid A deacylase LpxR family protein n=1 Tax=uncultured Aquimarina sp. TaxID=575652 RepID=UPI00262D1DB4|nr:lipid A deacylase LpxR family protein [uncultured Aquimarina sp.]
MNSKVPFLLLFTFINILSAQDDTEPQKKTFHSETKVVIDNDIFAVFRDSDRYYSYGIGLEYAFKKEKFLGLQKLFKTKKNVFYSIGLKIEGYTPSGVREFALTPEIEDRDDFDRPFAGLLYATLGATYTFERSFVKSEILTGIIGPSSQVGAIQDWFHENITGDPIYDGWQFQLENQFILNFKSSLLYDFNPSAKWFHIYAGGTAHLGSLYIRAAPTAGFRIGKYRSITESSGFHNSILLPKKNSELFFKFNVETRFVAYNATIQGNIFDDKAYGVDELNNISWHLSSGLFYSLNRFSINFIYLWSTGVLNDTENHGYGTFNVAYRF